MRLVCVVCFFFQAEDGIRDLVRSRGLGDVYKRQLPERAAPPRGFIERRLPLPPDPFSLQQLNNRLRMVAEADNVHGVVFVLSLIHI